VKPFVGPSGPGKKYIGFKLLVSHKSATGRNLLCVNREDLDFDELRGQIGL